MVASALLRCRRELSRRKAYGMEFPRVEISGVRIGEILGTGSFSKPGTELRLFILQARGYLEGAEIAHRQLHHQSPTQHG